MPRYYLLGGENTHKRDAQEVNQRAFNDAGGRPRVLVFSWTRASFDKTYPKRKLLFDYFRSLGSTTVNTMDYSSSCSEIKERICESDLVYLTGGVPSVLVERLKKLGSAFYLRSLRGLLLAEVLVHWRFAEKL